MNLRTVITSLMLAGTTCLSAQTQPVALMSMPPDLTVPAVTHGPPAPGRRVPLTTVGWECTDVRHLLYLPVDWKPGKKLPVFIEYAGNPYDHGHGNAGDGSVESCVMGYGISAGKGMIWASLPFIEPSGGVLQNALRWWGDVEETRDYCVETVRDICARYGGDPKRVFIGGFSRGSIAANLIGLHDDEIAKLWRGFVCHSHYDGSRRWPRDGGREAVLERLRRLGNRPQWISHEVEPMETKRWLGVTGIKGNWTFVPLPFPDHSGAWVLRDLPERKTLREWMKRVMK